MNVRNLEKIQDKWLLFQRFVMSIVDLHKSKSYKLTHAIAEPLFSNEHCE